ncbi:MAG: phenylalanine--tRNA ligase subunit beta [Gammaproteobacteria bacterium]|nr:MAG: phenylalanine--tRNA ligase subunit beta [Gammaproteobacteria bacterium]
MKFSEQWLREWVSPKMDINTLAHRLTMAGLEVGAVEPVAATLKRIVVGHVLSVEKHPEADKLKVCKVDVGQSRPLTIVCGASNVAEGIKAPTALVGATLPGGAKITKASLRGVTSSGMLCSGSELGLEEGSAGLLLLDSQSRAGQEIMDVLSLNDVSVELDLTPNRSDCLGVYGVAREVSALTGARLKTLKVPKARVQTKRKVTVTLSAKKACPRYTCRVIEGIDQSANTPLWMKERLRRSGLRSLGPVVDVSNYVLLELGQPMHAFDLGKINGGIKVRVARDKESITLLDGNTVKLDAGTLLIADNKRPLALAGIMGGEDSAVSNSTGDILLESAFFSADAISGRARSLGLHTDSSHRFERGVDPSMQRVALERATQLLLDIVGGKAGPIVEQQSKPHIPKHKAVHLRHERLQKLLGTRVPARKTEGLLRRLGMNVRTTTQGWHVTAPPYRFDIHSEVDLIEEVARGIGYDEIPARALRGPISLQIAREAMVQHNSLRHTLVNREYQEIITYSFIDEVLARQLDPSTEPVRLANPIASDMAVMRSSLWPGLLQTLAYNQNRQQQRLRLFELGRRFQGRGKQVKEELLIAGAICGSRTREQWGVTDRAVDFFDIKGDVGALLALWDVDEAWDFRPLEGHPALHPGQAASISRQGRRVGRLGALHPGLQADLSLERPVFLFELELSALNAAKLPKFSEISKFPAIRRDLAIVVGESIPAAEVINVIKESAGIWLINLELFDDYRGEGIDSGRKSLGFGLTLQESSRTLKEGEVDNIIDLVVAALRRDLGAELRN